MEAIEGQPTFYENAGAEMDGSVPEPWYRDGLTFACSRCGHCCTGAPGYVWVTLKEIETLARQLDLTLDEFTTRFVRQVGDRYSLREHTNGDCVFWDQTLGCTVYAARPVQCRTWPFWPAHLRSPDAWRDTQAFCPGAREGPLISAEEIEFQARRAGVALE